jgi:predicted aconitase
MRLSEKDERFLGGEHGEGASFAMQYIVKAAQEFGAAGLIDVRRAHVASAYDNSQVNHDFAARLAAAGTRVAVPTTLTACSHDLRGKTGDPGRAAALVELYKGMGCAPIMTCAPYHVGAEPGFGEQLAWCESSAVVFANSVLGARTNSYPEFFDMCAAITGRVPDVGLHRDEHRRATLLCRLYGIDDAWLRQDWFYGVLGIHLGLVSGDAVPAVDGLPGAVSREQLRTLGAAAAASGSVSLFHAIGITPEAATVDDAFQGQRPAAIARITAADVHATRALLGEPRSQRPSAVCLGTPHYSVEQFDRLAAILAGCRVAAGVNFFVSTSRHVLGLIEASGTAGVLRESGVDIITDRCTYYRPVLPGCDGYVLTDSAKWAWYAASSLDADVCYAAVEECVEAACRSVPQ